MPHYHQLRQEGVVGHPKSGQPTTNEVVRWSGKRRIRLGRKRKKQRGNEITAKQLERKAKQKGKAIHRAVVIQRRITIPRDPEWAGTR